MSISHTKAQETGLYYIQSRYYDPAIGRFLNADALVSTGQGILGNNMFAYCRNNPVCAQDASGYRDDWCTSVSKKSLERVIFGGGVAVGGCAVIFIGDLIRELIDRLTISLSKSGRSTYRNEFEEHHIVAKKAFNAKKVANILAEIFPDGVENEKNKVTLKTSVHRRIHTYTYYVIVNSAIISAYKRANGNHEQQKQNVIAVLDALKTFLEALNVLSTN